MAATNKILIQEFYILFQAAQSDLLARLAILKAKGAPSQDAVNALALEIAKLRKDLSDATVYLPSYDQRQYEQSLKSLEQSLDDLRSVSAGKPKFSFKRKVPKPAVSSSVSVAANTTDLLAPQPSKQSNSVVLAACSRQHLTWSSVPSVAALATDLSISDLDHCIVDLLQNSASVSIPTITAVHMRNVKNSILILPPVQGSAMVHDISNCILALGCHQFRMHTSTQVDVYLLIESNPIIEHCTKLRFAPYPTSLVGEDRLATPEKIPAVQDFSHIRATPSPNWSPLTSEERLRPEDWIDLTAPETESVDQILLQRFFVRPPP
ncbi:uncharacterized protein PHACADRAFT_172285 [Phanerochaete carnosa HHB-10118-sp]|uniref:C-CAP/cofactor C-like domain-containing protein n=1 Tax=Phanerochaete carnosa (strain HHB-10118-sp) TaxID=650164 RepID=K5X1H6_PHACS|nr:uncharacterized protein PHACADRAFT_172285 [Phanerochaete carnosa HHB-10118-sp]EKM56627.1 hypothetical protein PHACADRAFT_172285 [Phanerochaete carnosa HHB-10118-sp]